jgi:hypothetical protein
MAGGLTAQPNTTVPAEELLPQSRAVLPSSSRLAVALTEPVTTNVAQNVPAAAGQLRGVISQSLMIGGTSISNFTAADQNSMPGEGGQPEGLRAVDTALEVWGRPGADDVTVGWMPSQGATPSHDEEADQFWGEGDRDWFLARRFPWQALEGGRGAAPLPPHVA